MLVPSLRRPAAIVGFLLGAGAAGVSSSAAESSSSAASMSKLTASANKLQAKAEFMHAMESSPAARRLRADARARSNLRRKIAAAAVPRAASVPSFGRRLEDGENDEEDGVWDDFGFDVSDFSLKYAGCSAVATYSDEFAENDEMNTVVQSKKFVVFRLCPTDYCSDDQTFGCSSNYGEYVLDMEDYLMFMREYKEEQLERYCEFCEECMNAEEGEEEEEQQHEEEEEQNQEEDEEGEEEDRRRRLEDAAEGEDEQDEEDDNQDNEAANDNGDDYYNGCAYYDVCYNYANVCDVEDDENDGNNNNNNENEAVDISEFFECQEAGDGGYFVGPHCGSDKTTISIGVYADEECSIYVGETLSFYNIMGFEPDEDTLADYYDTDCTSCRESDKPYQNVEEDEEDGDDINELCENLYQQSAKCNRYLYDADDESYQGYNQEANSDEVCSFIQNVVTGQYDEYGYIYLDSSEYEKDNKDNRYASVEEVSIGQIFAILIMATLCVILVIWACFLHRSLTRNAPWRPRLNKQNGKSSGSVSRNQSGITNTRSGSYQAPNNPGQFA